MGGRPAQAGGCAGMGDTLIIRPRQSVYAHERSSVGGAHQLRESNSTGAPEASLSSLTGVWTLPSGSGVLAVTSNVRCSLTWRRCLVPTGTVALRGTGVASPSRTEKDNLTCCAPAA
jgi:hypothetical protein